MLFQLPSVDVTAYLGVNLGQMGDDLHHIIEWECIELEVH